MNKNPERPDDMDAIVSGVFNPKPAQPTEEELYWQRQEEIKRRVFGE